MKKGVPRRTVIEIYASSDCGKTSRPLPPFATRDWRTADGIDNQMKTFGLKTGAFAGYLLWD